MNEKIEISLRDLYAGLAMHACILSNRITTAQDIASSAVKYADALLRELEDGALSDSRKKKK
jgi:hypothetical protein